MDERSINDLEALILLARKYRVKRIAFGGLLVELEPTIPLQEPVTFPQEPTGEGEKRPSFDDFYPSRPLVFNLNGGRNG